MTAPGETKTAAENEETESEETAEELTDRTKENSAEGDEVQPAGHRADRNDPDLYLWRSDIPRSLRTSGGKPD